MSETFRPVTENLDINDSYTDVTLIRESSMSQLYRVSKAGKYLAIKTTKDNSAMQLAMLKREYEISITLDHYHIPHFYTYETNTPVGPGIIMEYIDGRNLADFLAEKPTIDTRRRVFSQLLEAVAYIHKHGIIHNDLKPENILISRANDDVKLLDFGLCNSDSHYLTKNMGGTREYASPELLAQKDNIDARSDIYSLGKIMQLIFPYSYKSYSRKCLCENPNERWENVDQLVRSWNKSSHPGYFILIAIMLAVVAVLAIFMNNSPSNNPHQQDLLDSLSFAKNEMSEAQLRAEQAQQEAANAKSEAANAKNEALLAQHQFDSIRNIHNLSEAEKMQIESERSRLTEEMKQSLLHHYKLAEDSIKKAPYIEFGAIIVGNYQSIMLKEKQKIQGNTSDEATKTIISTIYNDELLDYTNKLVKTAHQKPKLRVTEDSISTEEMEFYLKLINEKKPYRKYKQ